MLTLYGLITWHRYSVPMAENETSYPEWQAHLQKVMQHNGVYDWVVHNLYEDPSMSEVPPQTAQILITDLYQYRYLRNRNHLDEGIQLEVTYTNKNNLRTSVYYEIKPETQSPQEHHIYMPAEAYETTVNLARDSRRSVKNILHDTGILAKFNLSWPGADPEPKRFDTSIDSLQLIPAELAPHHQAQIMIGLTRIYENGFKSTEQVTVGPDVIGTDIYASLYPYQYLILQQLAATETAERETQIHLRTKETGILSTLTTELIAQGKVSLETASTVQIVDISHFREPAQAELAVGTKITYRYRNQEHPLIEETLDLRAGEAEISDGRYTIGETALEENQSHVIKELQRESGLTSEEIIVIYDIERNLAAYFETHDFNVRQLQVQITGIYRFSGFKPNEILVLTLKHAPRGVMNATADAWEEMALRVKLGEPADTNNELYVNQLQWRILHQLSQEIDDQALGKAYETRTKSKI